MFENLTNKFEEIFSSLKKAPSLDEAQVDEGLRGIRQALLEADVSLDVAKDFIEKVKPKALGQEIIRSTSPGDMVVKIVYDELVDLLGATNNEINLNAVPPVPMMLVGLQGSGKTTTTAKLAKFLENNKKKKIMMVSLDIYRPAAQEQLKSLGEKNNILTLLLFLYPYCQLQLELQHIYFLLHIHHLKMLHMAKLFYGPLGCLLYTSPSPRDATLSRMPSSA